MIRASDAFKAVIELYSFKVKSMIGLREKGAHSTLAETGAFKTQFSPRWMLRFGS